MATLSVLVLPVAARPMRFVATPGIEAGAKVTVPSRAEVAVETCVASNSLTAQRPCGGQGGAQA